MKLIDIKLVGQKSSRNYDCQSDFIDFCVPYIIEGMLYTHDIFCL